jgi:colicin import membrane protein
LNPKAALCACIELEIENQDEFTETGKKKMKTELIEIEKINPVELFTSNSLDQLLEQIKKECESAVLSVETAQGRKEIASLARKVAKSKVAIDSAGKELVAEWKRKSKLIDNSRKKAREFLDGLRDSVRKPLTDWELAEATRIEQKKLAAELLKAHSEALEIHKAWIKNRELEEREQIIREREAAEQQRIAAELAEQERKEREAEIAKQAAEQARMDAEEAARRKIDEAKRLEAEAIAKAERAERQRIELLEKAEREKQQAVRDAEAKAIAEAKTKQERQEKKRLEDQAAAEKLAADKEHKKKINNQALISFTENGFDIDLAKEIITLIANNRIKNISINYAPTATNLKDLAA